MSLGQRLDTVKNGADLCGLSKLQRIIKNGALFFKENSHLVRPDFSII